MGLDLVVVATPNATHAEVAAEALRAGSAVVVDKPMATSAAEARALIAQAESSDRLLTVYQNRRWDGDYLTASRLIADGALGDVHTFESRFEPWKTANRAGWKSSATVADGGDPLRPRPASRRPGAPPLRPGLRRARRDRDASPHRDGRRRRPPVAAPRERSPLASLDESRGRSTRPAPPGARIHGRLRRLGSGPAGGAARGRPVAHGRRIRTRRPRTARHARRRRRHPGGAHRAGRYPLFYGRLAAALRGEAEVPVDPRDAVAVLEVIEEARRGTC